jgi:hypothetical protein
MKKRNENTKRYREDKTFETGIIGRKTPRTQRRIIAFSFHVFFTAYIRKAINSTPMTINCPKLFHSIVFMIERGRYRMFLYVNGIWEYAVNIPDALSIKNLQIVYTAAARKNGYKSFPRDLIVKGENAVIAIIRNTNGT